MEGTIEDCTLRPQRSDYRYTDILYQYEKYGFSTLGEGGFGVIVGHKGCAVKIVKDITRCNELNKEKRIYKIIESYPHDNLVAKIPKFNIFREYNNFCLFNSQRISSPISGWGDPYDDEYGNGYIIGSSGNKYIFRDLDPTKGTYEIDQSLVEGVERPGSLVHFYVNDPDINLKYILDNNQGKLFGRQILQDYFGDPQIRDFTYHIGRLLSFLIFTCGILPFDVEVVLAARSQSDREVVPFIYDFNECLVIDDLPQVSEETLIVAIVNSLYSKNGRNYFPNNTNKYYGEFADGFLADLDSDRLLMAKKVLDQYNNKFTR